MSENLKLLFGWLSLTGVSQWLKTLTWGDASEIAQAASFVILAGYTLHKWIVFKRKNGRK